MSVPVILRFNLIAATIPESLLKKMLTPVNKLAQELRELIEVCCQNLLHVQELQKKAHEKKVKSQSYILCKKV